MGALLFKRRGITETEKGRFLLIGFKDVPLIDVFLPFPSCFYTPLTPLKREIIRYSFNFVSQKVSLYRILNGIEKVSIYWNHDMSTQRNTLSFPMRL